MPRRLNDTEPPVTRPTVTEITQQLEPVTHDTFIDAPEPDAPTAAGDEQRESSARS